jgi:hypothetical protein
LSRSALGSLTLREIGRNLFWGLLWLGSLVLVGGRFINYDGDVIEWETWGKFGLGLVVVIAAAATIWVASQ